MDFGVQKKFEIYNTLFLNLDYEGTGDVGQLVPVLGTVAKKKLQEGLDPIEILEVFWEDYNDLIKMDRFEFLFKVIQYVERQIVLFDSIEDSLSPYKLEDQQSLLISDLWTQSDNKENLLEHLNSFLLRIVLTAHPTQFYRPAVLDIIAKLRKAVSSNSIEDIDLLLHQLGLTSLVNTKSPTPFEEAKNIIHFCRYEYYDALGKFIFQLQKEHPGFKNNELITIGFWPCGDRDGNPFVTADVTKNVIDELRMTLMKCYYNDVKSLSGKITFRGVDDPLLTIQKELYDAMFDSSISINLKNILSKLNEIKAKVKTHYQGLYLDDLELLICKMNVFKKHFASLDIRQDHSKHVTCIEHILKYNRKINNSITELEEADLTRLLTEEFLNIPEESEVEGIVLDTIQNIQQLPSFQNSNGAASCHRYIISNSEDIFSVLFVFGLFRWIHKTEDFDFDIIPLFETMQGMEVSSDVMQFLYNHDKYSRHLKRRALQQTIMLGFSDGTKDGGYLKANWSIYKCKEALSQVSKSNNIAPVFFDGRGGPPARGGGKTANFYAARSKEIANNHIQLTIQGQTITSTYGTNEKFVFNAEQMIGSGLTSLMRESGQTINANQRALMEELSKLSFIKYNDLKNHPLFLPYLEQMTTLKFYGKTKIGSRPGKRNSDKKLSLSDLRAISYVGSWSQLKQNIPGYYGLGTAISELAAQGRLSEIQELYNELPLFKSLLDNSMMSLTKCFFQLTKYMERDEKFGSFWNMLHSEYELSKKMLLSVAGISKLMEKEQRSRDSIRMRDKIVIPLLLIQHYALQKINSDPNLENKEIFEKLVVRSLYGNINASRNSA